MYLDKFKTRFQELECLFLEDKLAYSTKLIPCTEEEINVIESRLQLSLPDAYKEFLLWGGCWARGFMEGSYFFFEDLLDLQEAAIELLKENQFPESLPSDAFVFFIHQGYYFTFFKTSEGHNPPVYSYLDGQTLPTFKKEYSSYSDFLIEQLELSAKCRTSSPLPEGVEEEIYRDKTLAESYPYLFEEE